MTLRKRMITMNSFLIMVVGWCAFGFGLEIWFGNDHDGHVWNTHISQEHLLTRLGRLEIMSFLKTDWKSPSGYHDHCDDWSATMPTIISNIVSSSSADWDNLQVIPFLKKYYLVLGVLGE